MVLLLDIGKWNKTARQACSPPGLLLRLTLVRVLLEQGDLLWVVNNIRPSSLADACMQALRSLCCAILCRPCFAVPCWQCRRVACCRHAVALLQAAWAPAGGLQAARHTCSAQPIYAAGPHQVHACDPLGRLLGPTPAPRPSAAGIEVQMHACIPSGLSTEACFCPWALQCSPLPAAQVRAPSVACL